MMPAEIQTAARPVYRVHEDDFAIVEGTLLRRITDVEVLAVVLGSGRPVEVDERGRRVDPADTLARGRLVVGLRLLDEWRAAKGAGLPAPPLCAVALACIAAVQSAGMDQEKPL